MARLFAWASLIAAATASNHMAGGGAGGGEKAANTLPFALGSGGNGADVLGVGNGHGQGNALGLGQGNGHAAQQAAKGHGGGGVQAAVHGSSVSVTIITTNAGGGAAAQKWNEPPMAMGMQHHVTVGGEAGLVFVPETLNAAVGDTVIFTFMSQNHTATQSTFAAPCAKMAMGVDSGFMANPNNTVSPAPTMEFQVTTTEPVWMYCAQGKHCEAGMVFSINPSAEKSQAKFVELAKAGAEAAAPAGTGAAATPPAASVASPTVAAATPQATLAQGEGQMGSGDACQCSCLCGMGAWPAGAGLNAAGGMPGTIPMSSVAKRAPLPLKPLYY
ncbi:hypothetical protein FQN53_006746 [Emmonsiellopsis sp. PD_33]|nr:hypothetical protein FQN53_006746 [Emmonsiellopsis sp. PD_33]